MQTVNDLWNDYRQQAISPDISDEELERCRLNFYSGMVAFSSLVADIALSNDSPSDRADRLLPHLRELNAFISSVGFDSTQFVDGKLAPFVTSVSH